MGLNPHSLWMRMVGMTVGLVFLVGSVIGSGAVYLIYKGEKDHMLEVGSNLAQLGAADFQSRIQRSVQDLQKFSCSPSMQNEAGIADHLNKLVEDSEVIDGMTYLSLTGKVVAAYTENNTPLGTDLSHRDYFQHILEGQAYDISDAYTATNGDKLVAISVPVRKKDGSLQGVLVGAIYLENSNPIGQIFGQMNFGFKGQVYLVDREGTILFHPMTELLYQSAKDDPAVRQVLAGKSGSLETDRQGEKWLSVYQPVKTLQWGVIAEVPTDNAFSSIRMNVFWIISFTLVSMAVGVFINLLFLRRIYAPIGHLDKTMHQVAAGNLSVRTEVRGQDEIAHCARSFNWMLDQLEEMAREERRVALQLHQAEKLAIVGELAAGTAHEIRNPLTVVKGYTQILNSKLEGTDKQEYIQIMLSEIARIEKIIQDFMILAKPPQTWEEVKINGLLSEVWRLVDYQVGEIQPEFFLAKQELLVRGDPSQLKQVFLNLINNALQAMEVEGTLTFKTWKEAQKVFVSLQDTGIGISPENLAKLGQPFFTTKESGTGLGLMVSYRIVQYHSGVICVDSKVGQGTIFTLSFPMF